MKTAITGAIEEVRYNGGHSTRKPSTVTMTVSHKFAIEVADLMEDYIKAGIEPDQGLLRLELIAVYADPVDADIQQYEVVDDDEMAEQIVEKLSNDIDESVSDALEGVDMEEKNG